MSYEIRPSRVEGNREVSVNDKPVTPVSSHDQPFEAEMAARDLRRSRTAEERRAGVEFRVVSRSGEPGHHVERFHNW